jgi:nucleoside-diphosphate-sugar epimerase
MSHRVLVTGADGLIGRQVVPLLGALGHHVIALDYRGATASAHESIQCDLLNPDSRKGAVQQARASHLLHLAWHDSPKERWSSPINRQWSEATLELLRDFGASGGHRAVCVGSCAEYDWSQAVLSEQTPLKPRSLYGEAKANAYRSCHAEASALGVSLAWARIFFCYGPGEPQGRLLGDLLMGLSQGKPVACTDGEQERDFLYTRDVAKALVETLFSTLEGPVNVGSGKATPVRELIE